MNVSGRDFLHEEPVSNRLRSRGPAVFYNRVRALGFLRLPPDGDTMIEIPPFAMQNYHCLCFTIEIVACSHRYYL